MDIDMIKKLIELDKKACKFMDNVKRENEESAKSLDNDKNNMYKNYMQRADNRINKAKIMSAQQEHAKRKLCDEKFDQISREMAKNYEENRELWVQDLFEKCIE